MWIRNTITAVAILYYNSLLLMLQCFLLLLITVKSVASGDVVPRKGNINFLPIVGKQSER